MPALRDSGNNIIGVKDSVTFVASDTDDFVSEEFPAWTSLFAAFQCTRTAGTITPRIQIYLADLWIEIATTAGVFAPAAAAVPAGRLGIISIGHQAIQYRRAPYRMRVILDTNGYAGTATFEVRS